MTATTAALPTTTSIEKGRDGWKASTCIEIGDGKVLVIETSKGYPREGGVLSTAAMHTRSNGFLSHRWGMSLSGAQLSKATSDFRETMSHAPGKVTEKLVRTHHATAIADISDVLARAIAYYA